ncbi:cell division ATP-binding protein FtsE [Paludibacter jiangxiensis]|uniref:Cell division transport system ATP-binding protein n=1 Tax=Paludibacter jiangxiensis TaxID=681398 RepID=A0A170Z1X7_9BACT|nr:ATP-binding cassette domain-containing protein [Paludibacter jiangxiensis]GAT62271.1 cell division transport system ATP-binding protein [Paludibacter jiangxiensis]
MESKELISYKDVDICHDDVTVLSSVDLKVAPGDFIYLLGKVGSGKSSFLKSLYAEIPVESGEARIFDYDLRKIKRTQIPFLRRKIGIIFQDFQLLPDRNVFDNLSFVLKATGWKNKEAIENQVIEVLEQVGMERKAKRWMHQLSGGEQQRIAIARALLNSPELILADEPTGNLDSENGHELISLLYEIHKAGTAVIIATHNLRWVEEFPGRVFHCVTEHLKEDKHDSDEPSASSEIEEINVPAEELPKVIADLNAEMGEDAGDEATTETPEKTEE